MNAKISESLRRCRLFAVSEYLLRNIIVKKLRALQWMNLADIIIPKMISVTTINV